MLMSGNDWSHGRPSGGSDRIHRLLDDWKNNGMLSFVSVMVILVGDMSANVYSSHHILEIFTA
jgi:hypothetical protein